MASERQLAANRANAKKSTGPRTSAGKQRTAQNAIRHGLLAQAVVLPGESLERFSHLLSEMHDQFQPQSPVEFALIETMVVSRWRQMRLWAIEKANLVKELDRQDALVGTNGQDPATKVAIAFTSLGDKTRSLDIMLRYEVRFDRLYNRALDRLLLFKKQKSDSAKQTQFVFDNLLA